MKWLFLAVGSVAGGFGRYALVNTAHRWFGGTFPLGTLAVNVAGCFVIGLLNGWMTLKGPLSHEARFLMITGFCGAFTTFSAFALDTVALSRNGQAGFAYANVVLNVLLSLASFLLADKLVRALA